MHSYQIRNYFVRCRRFTFLIIGETYDPWAESTTDSDDSGGKLQI